MKRWYMNLVIFIDFISLTLWRNYLKIFPMSSLKEILSFSFYELSKKSISIQKHKVEEN